jgi:hypothetical protein
MCKKVIGINIHNDLMAPIPGLAATWGKHPEMGKNSSKEFLLAKATRVLTCILTKENRVNINT